MMKSFSTMVYKAARATSKLFSSKFAKRTAVLGGATALVGYGYNQSQNTVRMLKSLPPTPTTEQVVAQNADEDFILPKRFRSDYGLLLGPNSNEKTRMIFQLMQNHKDMPIKYGEVPMTGSCEERMQRPLEEALGLKRRRNYPLYATLSDITIASLEYRLKNNLVPVVVLDHFERMANCDVEVRGLLSAAKINASRNTLTYIMVTDSAQSEADIERLGDETRLVKRVYKSD